MGGKNVDQCRIYNLENIKKPQIIYVISFIIMPKHCHMIIIIIFSSLLYKLGKIQLVLQYYYTYRPNKSNNLFYMQEVIVIKEI